MLCKVILGVTTTISLGSIAALLSVYFFLLQQVPEAIDCGDRAVSVRAKCYYFNEVKMSALNAQTKCRSMGGALPGTPETDWVSNVLTDLSNAPYWIKYSYKFDGLIWRDIYTNVTVRSLSMTVRSRGDIHKHPFCAVWAPKPLAEPCSNSHATVCVIKKRKL
ncbi:EEV envelope protein [Nile crocodilepox virus]|uniref:EEV envelope protein n=1 Tax=Nile crocodilepox virus (isolate Crocodylus niloticus/Zimbabwe/Ume/2001) TaxID=1289473 RepID=Q06ZZ3_CPRVZ|nr:EEV envelope protein [Nile crocodilepox virus]ABJ09049.1 EEV envelope protein [Nile crocodilepox virus]